MYMHLLLAAAAAAVPDCLPLDPLPTLCTAPMDLALVLDYSASAESYAADIQQLAQDFVALFDLSETGPRATVIVFSNTATQLTNLTTSAEAISQALADHDASFSGSSSLDLGLDLAKQAFDNEARTSVVAQKFVLILTDSHGSEHALAFWAANSLKADGARIFCLFWGGFAVLAKQYVSEPVATFFIQVASIAAAIAELNVVVSAACTDVHYACAISDGCGGTEEIAVNVTGSGLVGSSSELLCRFTFAEGNHLGELQNAGSECWNSCSQQGGFCSYCGGGACCRNNWSTDGPECLSATGLNNAHRCVAVTLAGFFSMPQERSNPRQATPLGLTILGPTMAQRATGRGTVS